MMCGNELSVVVDLTTVQKLMDLVVVLEHIRG